MYCTCAVRHLNNNRWRATFIQILFKKNGHWSREKLRARKHTKKKLKALETQAHSSRNPRLLKIKKKINYFHIVRLLYTARSKLNYKNVERIKRLRFVFFFQSSCTVCSRCDDFRIVFTIFLSNTTRSRTSTIKISPSIFVHYSTAEPEKRREEFPIQNENNTILILCIVNGRL